MKCNRIRYKFDKNIWLQLAPLIKLDNWHGLVAVIYDYCIIGLAILLFHYQNWFYPISIIFIGSRQRALATLLHESAHCVLANSRKLNYFIGTFLSGYLIFQEYYTYRDSHIKKHHAFLGSAENDPDYRYHLNEGLYKTKTSNEFLIKYIIRPLFLLKTTSYLSYLIKFRMQPNKQHYKHFIVMYGYLASIISVLCFYNCIEELILLWFIPLITTSNIVGWFNELSEHYPLVKNNKTDLYMSRNRFSHWLEHFIFNTHDENYHLTHHLFSSVPFWNLHKAHVILLTDNEYSTLNETAGGIFLSKDKKPTLLQKFLFGVKPPQKYNV